MRSNRERMDGYLHPLYAGSLREFGKPRELRRCGGWVLERRIPGSPYHDAMGCYPLFACQDWSQLHADLEEMGSNLVSVCLVTDPFGEYSTAYLRTCFRDVVIPFKEHFVIDLHRPVDGFVSSHHRRYARRAPRLLRAEKCEDPVSFVGEWVDLYATLIERHNVDGILAFSESAFKKQLNVPGMVAFRGVKGRFEGE